MHSLEDTEAKIDLCIKNKDKKLCYEILSNYTLWTRNIFLKSILNKNHEFFAEFMLEYNREFNLNDDDWYNMLSACNNFESVRFILNNIEKAIEIHLLMYYGDVVKEFLLVNNDFYMQKENIFSAMAKKNTMQHFVERYNYKEFSRFMFRINNMNTYNLNVSRIFNGNSKVTDNRANVGYCININNNINYFKMLGYNFKFEMAYSLAVVKGFLFYCYNHDDFILPRAIQGEIVSFLCKDAKTALNIDFSKSARAYAVLKYINSIIPNKEKNLNNNRNIVAALLELKVKDTGKYIEYINKDLYLHKNKLTGINFGACFYMSEIIYNVMHLQRKETYGYYDFNFLYDFAKKAYKGKFFGVKSNQANAYKTLQRQHLGLLPG